MDQDWQNLSDPILRWAAERPDTTALVEGRQSVSYGELGALVRRATVFLRQSGLAAGARAGIAMTNGIDHAILLLAMLRAVVLAERHDIGREVGEPDRGFGLVDVLAAGAAGAQRIDAHVRLVDVDLDAVVDRRIDVDAGEGRVAARIGIERRNAHQAMHAVLGFEPAIGVTALDLDGGRFDAGLFALSFLDIVDLEIVLFGPARVHAQQHSGPVLALGAAGAGMHFQVAIVDVGLAGKQRFEFAARHFGLQRPQSRFGFAHHLPIVLRLAEFDHRHLIVEFLRDARERAELVVERGALLHDAARALRIVPQIGVFGLAVQLGQPRARLVDIKDASSAARPTA